ncbi:MAG: 30S ribosomal protein S12 methylthiotransferase RimO [Muribaculaceae bacterium]|nr:30S ribosomal protein S12 methylthiotransferase RimO [Muribaculaceae bacterium]ROT22008.1 30S ribosomal protein S12 methylthiotransferase RimO [Muribaculaceae bacterium Isolate-114 (HZI)]ROT23935.1 30S ribosomal protein S12 methylthiotransferase RimO [Muribaculaceae bacterium Isolate-113 (HZI)]RXE69465.1 30S ribosomal protein S12 methylthiotransferase RimO [Muribaculaceae bacterium Isolate-001 (NCI)]GFI58565.1 ribosomal protein S12 methylthiotransferase RimO [Muribaculaceae bacterium]
MKKNRIDIITMGCSKNLIDSERIIRRLHAKGYDAVHDSGNPEGEYVVVNTCGFIADAKEESIEMLLDLAKLKQEGKIGKIVAMGCLTQRYREELTTELPEIDIMLGKFDWGNFIDSLPDLKDTAKPKQWERELTTPPHSAYLKISEGCNRFCAFCAIPLITGRHTSRTIEEILEETESLVAKGVKEFNVIAQDLSSYGIDIYGSHKLAELIDRMAGIKGVEWIRLHYAYPADFPFDILDVMARHENVCKYIDIALQHVSDKVLNNMRRHITKEETISLIAEMRKRVPDIRIRTTLMVGFPGEGEEEFQELLDFVRTQKFDRMGAFAYSEEDDTWAAKNLKDLIPEETKQKRLDLLMEAQMTIYEEKNAEMYGKEVTLLVDETEGDTRICRSQWDSPEVDMNYYVKGSDAKPGDFIRARITGDQLYDFEADAI